MNIRFSGLVLTPPTHLGPLPSAKRVPRLMNYATRKKIYRRIEAERGTKVITFVTGDRPGMETQIAPDSVDIFVDVLDEIGPTKKISLLLHTNGGHTSAAWRIVNLIRTFCDELEVMVPLKAMSAGTLVSLGADRLVMTKQAALGPIDPSLNHPLAPRAVSERTESSEGFPNRL